MRTAVIADIHANLEALQSVLARIEVLRAYEIVCLGDIVGYNADPNECVDIMRTRNIRCILGNHDACAAGLEEPDGFNPVARRAVLWTRAELTDENRLFLRNLPREQRVGDVFFFHGSIHDTDRYILYMNDAADNFTQLAGMGSSLWIGFFGHTHVGAVLYYYQRAVSVEHAPDLKLAEEKRYLINPGSVGQPRDGDPRASFLVYDADDHRVTFNRVEYDVHACQDKIIRAGLPSRLAERLASGT
jgi:diadenosine tetraphosphatase ApaH/serine/threonine PP2A family protein phosphatase